MKKKLPLTIILAVLGTVVGVLMYYVGTEVWYEYQQEQAWRKNFMRRKNDADTDEEPFIHRKYTSLTYGRDEDGEDDDFVDSISTQPESHGE